jgi:hypothetical protein
MSMTEVRGDASSSAKENDVDLKLEVVVIPVSDVDRAKEVYSKLGWGSMPTSLSITRCGARPPRSHEKRIGQADGKLAHWYTTYMIAELAGKELPT